MKTLEKIRAELLYAHKKICGALAVEFIGVVNFDYKGYKISVTANCFEIRSNDCSLHVWKFSARKTQISICGDIAEALKLAKIAKDWKKIVEFIKSKNL